MQEDKNEAIRQARRFYHFIDETLGTHCEKIRSNQEHFQ